MKAQIDDQLKKDRLENNKWWVGEVWKARAVLIDLNTKAISKKITGSVVAQKFLNDIAYKKKDFISFNTPLYNFPVYSVANKIKYKRIKTSVGQLSLIEQLEEVDSRKQKSSFAPNFIHSMDAEVLGYVIDNFKGEIGAIHDCVIIHPNEAEQARELFREGFVKVMETEPIKKLEEEQQVEGVSIELEHNLDLQDVLKAEYILS